MKITAISDTHLKHEILNLAPGDVLIHAGDCTNNGTAPEVISFLEWFKKQPFKYKILVPGNHDFLFEKATSMCYLLCQERGINLLIDEGMYIPNSMRSYYIHGSPINTCGNWAFSHASCKNYDFRKQYDKIPTNIDVDILVTHGPPLGIMDSIPNYPERLGCEDLLDKVNEIEPMVHIFGHIHEQYGHEHINGIDFYNVAIKDENYKEQNRPTLIEL